MAEWNLVASNGVGVVTQHQSCLYEQSVLEAFYKAGGVMLKDGKKLSLKAAIEELPKEKRRK